MLGNKTIIANSGTGHFLPEARYEKTELKNWQKDPKKFIGQIVHVMPIEFISAQGILNVEGRNFEGVMRLEDMTIYPLTFFEGTKTPKFLQKIFALNHCMTAEIIGYEEDEERFILSRKEVMKEAIESGMFAVGNTFEAFKINVAKSTTFVDLGAGIIAIIPVLELSTSHIADVNGFWDGIEYIPVKIIENINNRIVCSYKRTFKEKELTVGDIILGKITNDIPDGSGVFVEISPLQVGILDLEGFVVVEPGEYTRGPHIIRGKKYKFRVHRIREQKEGDNRNKKRYHLRMI